VIAGAKESDLPVILALQRAAFREEAELVGDLNIKPMAQTLDELKNEHTRGIVLKYVENGTIIGSVRARVMGDTCLISRLVVHPDHWRKGIGKALMREIERSYPQVRRYELFTRADHPRNRPFYRALGYVPVRTERVSNTLSFVYLEKRNEP
jgi:GNAT superfamily N-acetyltransferase